MELQFACLDFLQPFGAARVQDFEIARRMIRGARRGFPMKIRTFRFLALTPCLILLGAALAPTDATAGVNGREANQGDRIARGVSSGSLTTGETARLGAQQARIEHMERRFRANDGQLGPRERQKLDGALDRSRNQIYRAKHNDRE